jgi:hypothetical protein
MFIALGCKLHIFQLKQQIQIGHFTVKITALGDVMPHNLINKYQHFVAAYCFILGAEKSGTGTVTRHPLFPGNFER